MTVVLALYLLGVVSPVNCLLRQGPCQVLGHFPTLVSCEAARDGMVEGRSQWPL